MQRITYDCINYNFSVYDLFIPKIDVLYKLCISSDKTKMVLISIIRLIVLMGIFYFLYWMKWIAFDMNKITPTLLFSLFMAYLIVNLTYIIIAMMKKVVVDKDILEETVDDLAGVLYQNKVSKPANLPPAL